jgi:hypothetical protein
MYPPFDHTLAERPEQPPYRAAHGRRMVEEKNAGKYETVTAIRMGG